MTTPQATQAGASGGGTRPAVELIGIEKRFPGVIANYDVNLTVNVGTIHAIVGENGAGKSTLMKTLYGMHQPEAGTIRVNGVEQRFANPAAAISVGIGMVHQHFMLADNLSVYENVILGDEPGRILNGSRGAARLAELARSFGVDVDLDSPVSELGVGDRQRVEILKVLYRGAKIIILDEPTAVLVPQEVDELFVSLRALVDDGATVIFISHKLDEVLAVADAITVIRSGTTVTTVSPEGVTRRKLGELMVGSELPDPSGRETEPGSEVRLEVKGLRRGVVGAPPRVENVSFAVHSGEVLGIAGVEGNGQDELLQAILGIDDDTSASESAGEVYLMGELADGASTAERRDRGIAYIPFDRHREGLLLDLPLWENVMLGRERESIFHAGPILSNKAARSEARRVISEFGVLTPSETVPAFALSGGNQQKLIVGRELGTHPKVLLAAHPTRGVDIGAQAAIWDQLRAARDAGLAIVLVSADLDELIGLSDRLLVMFEGRVTATLDDTEISAESLGAYMTGELQNVDVVEVQP